MKKLLLTVVAVSLGYLSIAQNKPAENHIINTGTMGWEYITLDDTLDAVIIEYAPAFAYCGTLATASVTIVKRSDGELLRVVTLCNTSKEIMPGDAIRVIPSQRPSFAVSHPFQNTESDYAKATKLTTFADMQKIGLR